MRKIFNKIILIALLIVMPSVASCGETNIKQMPGKQQISIFSRPRAERNGLNKDGKKADWLDVESFCCYYGKYDEKMTDYDVAICESANLGEEGIKKINDKGVYSICYISIGEDRSLNVGDGLGEGGYASYYIYENGAPKINVNWNSYFVDGGSPVWQSVILNEARDILALGADGLFLDTIDSADVDSSTIGGMVSLIKRLREEFPEAKLVANRGFSVLPYVSKYIDGLMFESFNTTWNFEKGYAEDLSESANEYNISTAVNTINKQRQYYYFPVFALDYYNDFETYMIQTYIDRSWTYDFIPYLTPTVMLDSVNVYSEKPQSARGSIALKGEGDIAENAGKPNGDASADNLAYAGNGAAVKVDSYFSVDYRNNKTAAINDGFIKDDMYWAKRAWASAEEKPDGEIYEDDHFIEFTFKDSENISKINIYWAFDNGIYYSSQTVVIEEYKNNEWKEIKKFENIPGNLNKSEITFDSVNTSKIRIRQPAGFGASYRKGIMWVQEVEIYS